MIDTTLCPFCGESHESTFTMSGNPYSSTYHICQNCNIAFFYLPKYNQIHYMKYRISSAWFVMPICKPERVIFT